MFSLLTQRYTGSPESVIGSDLSLFKDKENFIPKLKEIINSELTQDFWEITLPQRLISSSTDNHAFLVYTASLVYSDVYVPFSDIKLRDYLKPFPTMKKKTIDLHHIFPKNYLKELGITNKKEIGQVANLIYIEYKDNINIGDKPPSEYWPLMAKDLSPEEEKELLKTYDLPENFWEMDYFEFLRERRNLMARKIRDYFMKI